ncbi:calponin homology domain-containing protein DDB_G0272472 [Culicoides brevitarsis]|uniref:calponin homology domain-containing protein DDB_G0272472 n=1 Tax=Culicoides brevitarsis TaxID=469753 RepID=UPI00307BD704
MNLSELKTNPTMDVLNSKKSKHKETRWNRIRKKHLNNLTVTTSTVKKFINMNFVHENEIQSMTNPDGLRRQLLNPVVVMNLRHEMIRNKFITEERKDSTPTRDLLKAVRDNEYMEREELRQKNLIESELNKFRKQMNTRPKSRLGSSKKSHLLINLPTKLDPIEHVTEENDDFENKENAGDLLTDLDTEDYINKCYSEVVEVSPNDRSRHTTTPQGSLDEDYDEEYEENVISHPENRIVRFGENVEVIEYDQETSCSISSLTTNSDLYLEMQDSDTEPVRDTTEDFEKFEPEVYSNFTKKITTKFENNGYYYSENTIEMTDNFLKITKYENCRKCEEINYFGEHIFDENRHRFTEILEIEPPVETKKDVSRDEIEKTDDSQLMLIKKMDIEPKDYTNLIVKNGYRFEEKDKIIQELFKTEEKPKKDPNLELLRWAFNRWHQKAVIGRITRDNPVSKKDRIKKINEFLNRINIEKRHFFNEAVRKAMDSQKHIDSVTLKKNYEHKLKIQQDIIDLQKLKLSRQERVITELKLHKLSDEARAAKQELKNELSHLSRRGDIKLRARVKSIQITGNIKSDTDDDETKKLQAQGLVVPKFLAKMQARAMERTMKHQEAKERRLRLEQEREDARLAADEAKRQLDEEAKKARMEELREKRRQEKMDKVQREKDRINYLEGMKKAKEFYLKLLLRRGMRHFKMVLEIKRMNEIKAELHYKKRLQLMCFASWGGYTKMVITEREKKAADFYRKYVLRNAFRLWKDYFLLQQSKMLLAIDWYELQFMSKVIKAWYERVQELKKVEAVKIERADQHYHVQLKWRCLIYWSRLPAINKIEKETEERRQKWRLKIMELCPDYKPKHWSDEEGET